MEQTQTVVNVTRNISRVDEVCMASGNYQLKAEVEYIGGRMRKVGNGSVNSTETGQYIGSFNAQSINSLNVCLQSVNSRNERESIYAAVEDFVEAVNIDSVN